MRTLANFTALVPSKPLYMENLTGGAEIKYSAADFRAGTAAVNRRQGVLGVMDFWVYQADNVGYAIKVIAGSAIVGSYLVTLPEDLPITLQFATNPGTTCVHKVYLVVNDEAYNANTVGYEAHIQGMESVNGSVPPLPTFSAGYIELCSITYKPGQTNVQNKDIANTKPHGGGGGVFWNLTPASGYSAMSGTFYAPFGARCNDGVVRLSGTIGKANGQAFIQDTSAIVGTLPAALRPKRNHSILGVNEIPFDAAPPPGIPVPKNGPRTFVLGVGSDGALTAIMPTGSSAYNVVLDGLSYDLD